MLLVVLHDDQTPYAEGVATTKLHGTPFDLKAHGARVIIQLRDMRQDLSIDFGTDCFGEMFRKFRVLDLTGEGGLYAKSSTLVELYGSVNIQNRCKREEGRSADSIPTFQYFQHSAVIDFSKSQALQDFSIDVHKCVESLEVVLLLHFFHESSLGDFV